MLWNVFFLNVRNKSIKKAQVFTFKKKKAKFPNFLQKKTFWKEHKKRFNSKFWTSWQSVKMIWRKEVTGNVTFLCHSKNKLPDRACLHFLQHEPIFLLTLTRKLYTGMVTNSRQYYKKYSIYIYLQGVWTGLKLIFQVTCHFLSPIFFEKNFLTFFPQSSQKKTWTASQRVSNT